MALSFLKFAPVYKDYLWGGDRIKAIFNRTDAPEICAESWEISAHSDGMSIVTDGDQKGKSLDALCKEFGRSLLGSKSPTDNRFPLLMKLIDAKSSLSVQIHPSKSDPNVDPNEYKNECWHNLGTTEDAAIYAGFKDEYADKASFEALTKDNLSNFGKALKVFKPQIGETLFIPTGLVHAIGQGCLVYEVQQNSNTTYRFYDWDRVGADGKPRTLHVDEGMRSIDWTLPPPEFVAPAAQRGQTLKSVLETPYFKIFELGPEDESAWLDTKCESFHALFVKEGTYEITSRDASVTLTKGESLLVPASLCNYRVHAQSEGARILITTL